MFNKCIKHDVLHRCLLSLSAYLPDEEPELGVAVGPHHGVEAGEDPDGEGHVDAAGLLEDSARGDEDAGADDGAHDDGAALDQPQRLLHTHRLLLLHLLNLFKREYE